MKICPFCKISIDDNSYFCDQCGKELRICPQCLTFGRGKICTKCGTKLMLAKDFNQETYNNRPINTIASKAVQPISTTLEGLGNSASLTLNSEKGKYLIGRRAGDWVSVFCKNGFISGKHAELNFDPAQQTWSIVDLGSTNGTFINEKKLIKGEKTPFKTGDTIRIAFIKFTVK
ncbi:MAG: FHA domain-containing protein [Bacteroidaceae bacterium]|nr:FHA domain-containing protein [Bacteroidaceae bacterium]